MSSTRESLKVLFEKYGLRYDAANPQSKDNDVYAHKHYKIITRGGIQKIERQAGIQCTFKPLFVDPNNFVVHGFGTSPTGAVYETFASATESNCTNEYKAEMAEKRCRSRIILTLAGLYEEGVYGEDEIDEKPTTTTAKYKGS